MMRLVTRSILTQNTCFWALWWTYSLLLQVVLYEDELADNGVSLLTVKVVKIEFSSLFFQSHSFTIMWIWMSSVLDTRDKLCVCFCLCFSESHAKLMVPPLTILGESIRKVHSQKIKSLRKNMWSSLTVMMFRFSSSTRLLFYSLELMVCLWDWERLECIIHLAKMRHQLFFVKTVGEKLHSSLYLRLVFFTCRTDY